MIRSGTVSSSAAKAASVSTRFQTARSPAARRCSATSSASSGRSSTIRTRSGSSMWLRQLRRAAASRCRRQPPTCASQGEIKSRALVGFSLRPDAAYESPNDPVDDRQADAGTFVLLGPVYPLKDPEKLVRVAHVEPHAVVLDEKERSGRVGIGSAADSDSRKVTTPRILQGVADEVDEHLLEQGRLGKAIGKLFNREFHRATLQHWGQLPKGSLDDVGCRYRAALEPLVADFREGEQVVDQLRHPHAAGRHALEVSPGFRVELGRVMLYQELHETVDRPERRPQVVRDAVGEGLQLRVGRLEIRRSLGDATLEIGVQPPNLRFDLVPFADVSRDRRGADDRALAAVYGRDRDGNVNRLSVLPTPHRLELLDPLTDLDSFQDLGNLVDVVRRSEHGDVAPEHLEGGISVNALGAAIPAQDRAHEILRDDGVGR